MRQALTVLLLGIAVSSCMSFSDRSMRPVRNSISEQMPEIRLEKEMAIAVGGGMFDFLDIVTFNEADLSEVDHLQVAVYEVYPRGSDANFSDDVFQASLQAKDASLTWERIVRVREEGEQVWVYVGMDLERQSLDAVSVFVVEQDELVLINMDGELMELIEYAFEPARGHPGAYSGSRKSG